VAYSPRGAAKFPAWGKRRSSSLPLRPNRRVAGGRDRHRRLAGLGADFSWRRSGLGMAGMRRCGHGALSGRGAGSGTITGLPVRRADSRIAAAWLAGLFAAAELGVAERASLLAGRPGPGQRDCGRIVCACFGVGLNTLTTAIRDQGLATPEAIGATLRAGSNCGSCLPELRQLLQERG
jgi:bacterioferritin-associated ferredoxin